MKKVNKIYYNPPPLPIVYYCKYCGHAMGEQKVVIDEYYTDDGSPNYLIWLRCINKHRALFEWKRNKDKKYYLNFHFASRGS